MDDDFRRAHDDGRGNIHVFAMLDARMVTVVTMVAIRKNAARRAYKRDKAGEQKNYLHF
jgi:hypothetical protein